MAADGRMVLTVQPHAVERGPAPAGESAGLARQALFATSAATAVIAVCNLVTGLIAARSLGPDGRGELTTISVWAATVLYAGTFGLPEAVAYYAAALRNARDRVWMTGQAAAIVIGAVITLAGWWLLPVVLAGQRPVLVESARWYLLWFAVPCFGSLCASAWLQGAGLSAAFNISRASIHLIHAAGMLLLLGAGIRSVAAFALVLLIGNAAAWVVAVAYGPWSRALAREPSIGLARRLVHYGVRVQFGSWANAANLRLDQLLLSLFAPAASLGLYVVAVSYSGMLQMISGSAMLVMLPDVIERHERGASSACVARWHRRVLWAMAVPALGVGAASFVLLPLLFGGAFRAAVPLVGWLVPATVLLGMNQILSTAFRGAGRPETASTAEIVGVIVTAAALAALLPPYGVYGAASASLLAYAASYAYLLRQARRFFHFTVADATLLRRGDLAAALAAVRAWTR